METVLKLPKMWRYFILNSSRDLALVPGSGTLYREDEDLFQRRRRFWLYIRNLLRVDFLSCHKSIQHIFRN